MTGIRLLRTAVVEVVEAVMLCNPESSLLLNAPSCLWAAFRIVTALSARHRN